MSKTLACLGLLTLVVVPMAASAATESCTYLRNSIDQGKAQLDDAESEQVYQVELSQDLDEEIEFLRAERRAQRCIGDRNMDREVIRRCLELGHRLLEVRRRQLAADETAHGLDGRILEIMDRIEAFTVRYKRRCNCWQPPRRHTAMRGSNIAGFQAEDVDRCKLACDNSPKCRSVDFNPTTGACYLNDRDMKRSGAAESNLVTRPNWPFDYYERC